MQKSLVDMWVGNNDNDNNVRMKGNIRIHVCLMIYKKVIILVLSSY